MFRMHAFSRSHKERFYTSKHLIFSLKRGEHGSQDVLNRVIFLSIQSSYISYDYVIFFFLYGFICHYWTFLFPTIYVTFHTITIIIVIILVTILLFIVY